LLAGATCFAGEKSYSSCFFLSVQRNLSSPLFAPFWPFLVERGGVFRPFVRHFRLVENGRGVFLHGSNKSSLFGSENFSTPVLFLLLDGAVQ